MRIQLGKLRKIIQEASFDSEIIVMNGSTPVRERQSSNSSELLRSYIRESIGLERGLLSEWDLALAYSKGSYLLSESESTRGRLIVEGLFQSVAGAMKWAGQKIGSGVKAIVKAGGEALDVAGKALMQILEKIPGGKDAFEFLKEFTGETADKIKDYVIESAKEFGKFLTEKKDEILGGVFEIGSKDSSIMTKLKEMVEKSKEDFGDQFDKVKEWLNNFKENPIEAAKEFFSLRSILGSIVSNVVEMILKTKGDLSKKIVGIFNSAGFTSSKMGMFFLRVLTFFSGEMGGEETLQAAGKMWNAAKKIGSKSVDLENRGRALFDVIPKIVKGLISGKSALESVVRSAMGDPAALTNLFKNAIILIKKALSNLIKKGSEAILKAIKIDPEGDTGKLVVNAMAGLIGEEEG